MGLISDIRNYNNLAITADNAMRLSSKSVSNISSKFLHKNIGLNRNVSKVIGDGMSPIVHQYSRTAIIKQVLRKMHQKRFLNTKAKMISNYLDHIHKRQKKQLNND